MPNYKLSYFNARGIGEPIRFVLALAEVEYEDFRFEHDEWASIKPNMKWGQVPALTFGDTQISQSATICRFLARKYNLVGEDEVEAAYADEIVDAIKDLLPEFRKVYFEPDPEKRLTIFKAFVETHLNPFLTRLTQLKMANGGKWLVGKNVTWADLFAASMMEFWSSPTKTDVLAEFPTLKAHKEAVYSLPKIKEWLQRRPETDH